MSGALIRSLLAVLTLGVWWLLVLGWAARVAPGDPWVASNAFVLDGNRAQSVFGEARIAAEGLQVDALGAHGLSLQSWKLHTPVRASDYSILRYQLAGLPQRMELAWFFRRADQRGDVITISLPAPGAASGTIDLSQVPQWQGEIVELGFSEYARTQYAKLQFPFAPFTLVGMQLEPRSWSGLLHALFTDWFAYVPWSQRSINALGRSSPLRQPRSMTLVLAIGLAGSWLALWAIFGFRVRGRGVRLAMLVAAVGWLLLDIGWMWTLSQRHTATQAVYGGKTWAERKALQADPELMQFAARVRAMVEGMPTGQRVLLWSASSYDEGRLAYHLRPLNVAELYANTNLQAMPGGVLLVIDDSDGQWQYAASTGKLHGPSRRFLAHRIFQRDDLGLYRLDAGAVQ